MEITLTQSLLEVVVECMLITDMQMPMNSKMILVCIFFFFTILLLFYICLVIYCCTDILENLVNGGGAIRLTIGNILSLLCFLYIEFHDIK